MSRRKNTKPSVEEQVRTHKVNPHLLWTESDPRPPERAVLELAAEIAYEEDRRVSTPPYRTHVSVSWDAQVRAANYFNEHGLYKTLGYLLDLRTKRERAEAAAGGAS